MMGAPDASREMAGGTVDPPAEDTDKAIRRKRLRLTMPVLTQRPGRRGSSVLRSSFGIAAATVLLFVASGLAEPRLLGSSALGGMLPFAAILAIVGLGQTLVVQQGGIDLSVPGVMSLSGVIIGRYTQMWPEGGLPVLFSGIACAFAAALVAGLINGLLVSRARVSAIVATLGMNAVLYGVDVWISGGSPVAVPEALTHFANSRILGVSTLAYIAVALACVVVFLIKKTVFGRRFEAVGANPRAARAAGVVSGRYLLAAFAGGSLLYSLGGVLLAGLMELPSAFQGDVYLMPSIAAVVLGGTSLFGGTGNLVATVIAALFLTQLQQLVLTTGLSVGVQNLFQGAAIIIGVGVYRFEPRQIMDAIRRRASRRMTVKGGSP